MISVNWFVEIGFFSITLAYLPRDTGKAIFFRFVNRIIKAAVTDEGHNIIKIICVNGPSL